MGKQRFIKQTEIPTSPEALFAWHEQPGAIEKLTPPWEKVEMVKCADNLQIGARVIFKVFIGPFPKTWVAEHVEYDPPRLFADIQRQGPFAYWYHRHRFELTERGTTMMIDDIEYELPLGWLGELFGSGFACAKLQKIFDYRHQIVLENFK